MRSIRATSMAAVLVVLSVTAGGAQAKSSGMRAIAERLHASLTPVQRDQAVRAFDDPARKQELFPGGKRVGVQIRDLNKEQKELALALLKAFLSDEGQKKAEQIAAQEGKGGL